MGGVSSWTLPGLLSVVSATAQHRAATTTTPRRPIGAGGGEEQAVRLGVRATMHALFTGEVEWKMTSARADYFLPVISEFDPDDRGCARVKVRIVQRPEWVQ